MTAQDGASPAPGVYREDQGALDTGTLPGLLQSVQELVERKHLALERELAEVRRQRDKAEAVAADRGAHLDEVERRRVALVRMLEEVTVGRDQARDQAAELMRETAQLHKALDSLGTSPERLAQQVGAGEAVHLYGRTYVDRDLLVRLAGDGRVEPRTPDVAQAFAGAEELASLRDGTVQVESQLLEAEGGVFVPIPAGHMLSVTVTPYDSTPEPDHDSTCRHD